MLREAGKFEAIEVRASDGVIGRVADLLFDDRFWHIRYFVIATGDWLGGRRVLISPLAVPPNQGADDSLAVNLSRDQVRDSPNVDATVNLTREHELSLREYYRWPPYWGASITLSGDVMPEALSPVSPPPEEDAAPGKSDEDPTPSEPEPPRDDAHLRGTRHVRGHSLVATDGEIGHVEDFLIDQAHWQIRYLVVDTRNWWPGKKVVIAPLWLRRVSWSEEKVFVDLSRNAVRASP